MRKIFFIIQVLAIIFICSSSALSECNIKVTDKKGYLVECQLVNENEKKTFSSNSDGIIQIKDEDFIKFENTSFKLVFSNRLAGLIYETRLLKKSGEEVPLSGRNGQYTLRSLCGEEGKNEYTVPNLKRGLAK